jgi:hypothetical protein
MNPHGIAARTLERWSFDAPEPPRRPVIVANPAGDRRFRAQIDAGILAGARSPDTLEAILRTRYPNAVVRPRELAGERVPVWYVYREGHWIRSDEAHA